MLSLLLNKHIVYALLSKPKLFPALIISLFTHRFKILLEKYYQYVYVLRSQHTKETNLNFPHMSFVEFHVACF